MSKLAITFSLNDETKKRLHPEALRCFNDCMADLEKDQQKALKNLNGDDFAYLSTNGNNSLQTRFDEMMEVLSKYVDIEDGATNYSEVKSALKGPILKTEILLKEAFVRKLMIGLVEPVAELIGFKHEDIKRLPEGALEGLYDHWNEVKKEVPQLDGLTANEISAEIAMYLKPSDKERLQKRQEAIVKFLQKCVNSDDYSPQYTSYWSDMIDLKYLLKEVYHQKKVKAKEECQRQKRKAAYSHVYPLQLSKDVKRYLPYNQQDVLKAVGKAVEAYLKEGPDNYLDSFATQEYRFWRRKINELKEEERQEIVANEERARQKIVANSAAREYNKRLNKEKARLKALLSPAEKGTWSSLPDRIKARCYRGQPLHQILSKEEISDLDEKNRKTGDSKLHEIISGEFSQFFDGECYRNFYFLTVAEYSYEGLPFLDFGFDVLADVEVRVSLKPGPKTFRDHTYNLPMKENAVKELLGSLYFVTGEDFGYTFYQTIPLVLVLGLFNGEIPKGIIPTLVGEDIVTYKIPKYKEEVTIDDRFASYLKDIGSIDEMIKRGILSEKVGNIAKRELEKLKGASSKEQETPVVQEASPQKAKILRKDTLKAKAFRLFDEGKRPSDLEVKALKIKPGVLYGYYQEWKKLTAQ